MVLGIVDTGSCKTIVDTKLCQAAGLRFRPAKGGDCGTYAVPGTGATNFYAGKIEDDVTLQFGDQVVYILRGMRVIEHP